MAASIVSENFKEEIALPIRGRKRKLNREDLVDYYGGERLELNATVRERTLRELAACREDWAQLIGRSFLPAAARERYQALLAARGDGVFGERP
jgi:serine/threonine-protein kinase HipA